MNEEKNRKFFYRIARFLLFSLPFSAVAQVKMNGSVITGKRQPVKGANVLLLNAGDSMLLKGMLTRMDGSFSFEDVKTGNYILMASCVGFSKVYMPVIIIAPAQPMVDLKAIELTEEVLELQRVSIQSVRPLLEQKIDRLVVNVKNSITSAGSTALEVLQRSPGVIINRQANSISMSGRDGVMIMINGKISYMPATALIDMLAGMNAGNIDRIELITTPPSSLDAQGNAGFINIVLISNPDLGVNGSFSATEGYGQGQNPSASINLNYRTSKINLFGDYSYSLDKRLPFFSNYRKVARDGDRLESFTETDRVPTRINHNARIGVDYQISKKLMIGFLASAYINRYSMHETVTNRNNRNGLPDTIVVSNNKETNSWRHAMGNFNIAYTIKAGETISLDMDYLLYHNRQPFEYNNNYYNGANAFLSEENVRTSKRTPIKFWVEKVDYTKKLNDRSSLEAGVKVTFSKFNNDVTVERLKNSIWQIDPDYSSNAMLKENISAAYIAYNINPDENTAFKLGLRYEYINSNLGTLVTKNIVDRHYGQLFPSFFVSRKINEDQTINFSYSRRINRPTFNDMAPFIFFFDPNTFFSGNPALQPSTSDNIKAEVKVKKLIISMAYSYDNNSIAVFQSKIDPKTNKQIIVAENLKHLQSVALLIALPLEINKWWSMQNNLIGTWQQISANYNNTPFDVQLANLNIRTTQGFKLPMNYAVELTAFYQTASIFGRYRVAPYGGIDIGLQKKFKNNKGRIRLAASNIISSDKFIWQSNMESDNYSKTTLQFNKATVSLTYSCNFGRSSVKAARDRITGSAEESGRVQ